MITDKYLLEEIGTRQEITSSMVARANYKRDIKFWRSIVSMSSKELMQQEIIQRQCYGLKFGPSIGSGILGDIFGGALGGMFTGRCPCCGK